MMLGFAPMDRAWRPARESEREEKPRIQYVWEALAAIHEGRWDDAEELLDGESGDAAVLNLRGVVCQAKRRWKEARRFYGRAMKLGYAPGEQNLRRLYELHTFGRTDLEIVLVDRAIAREMESRFALPLMRQ